MSIQPAKGPPLPQRNESLHGLRGAATLAVFSYHLYANAVVYGIAPGAPPGSLAAEAIELLRVSVPVFFLISSYVITGVLTREESALGFLWRRAQRIYPTFLVPHVLLFSLGPWIGLRWLAEVDPAQWCGHFFSNLLFLPGVFDLPIAQPVAWTLSYEVMFYLFAASALVLLRRRLSGPRAGAWLAWGLLACTALWHRPVFWFFVVGVVCQLLKQPIERCAQRCGLVHSLVACAALMLMHYLFNPATALSAWIGVPLLAVFMTERGLLCRICRQASLMYLGTISYSLYLWHPLVISVFRRTFVATNCFASQPALRALMFVVAATGTTLLLSYLSYELLERRWTRFLSQRLGRRHDALPLGTPARAS